MKINLKMNKNQLRNKKYHILKEKTKKMYQYLKKKRQKPKLKRIQKRRNENKKIK